MKSQWWNITRAALQGKAMMISALCEMMCAERTFGKGKNYKQFSTSGLRPGRSYGRVLFIGTMIWTGTARVRKNRVLACTLWFWLVGINTISHSCKMWWQNGNSIKGWNWTLLACEVMGYYRWKVVKRCTLFILECNDLNWNRVNKITKQ